MIYVLDEIDSYFTTVKQRATSNMFKLFKTIDNWEFTGTDRELYINVYDEEKDTCVKKILVKTRSSSGVEEITKGYKELKREYKKSVRSCAFFRRK